MLVLLIMYPIIRYRYITFRYIILCFFLLTIIKLTSIYYNDLQQRSIDKSSSSSSSSLPFDINERIKKSLNISNEIKISTNQTLINYYKQYVERTNNKQFMSNSNLFLFNQTRYILLVQVHTRVVYLKKFIQMLQDVEKINETLVIFSHDFIHSDINALIQNISFVPVRKSFVYKLDFVIHS